MVIKKSSLIILVAFLFIISGCQHNEGNTFTPSESTITLTLTPSISRSNSITSTNNNLSITKITPMPSVVPSIFTSTKLDEFTEKDVILFSLSEGIEQWVDIAFLTIDDHTVHCITCGITDAIIDIYNYSRFYSPTWAPEGNSYAFAMLSEERQSIFLRSGEQKGSELIAEPETFYYDLAWSGDGQHIAFSAFENNRSNICFVSAVINQYRKSCISPESSNESPSWSKDSRNILFSAGGGIYSPGVKQNDLYYWNINSGEVVQMTETPESETVAKWNSDNSKLAFISRNNQTLVYTLYIAEPDGSNPLPVAGTGDVRDFDWSPDGKYIVYTEVSTIVNKNCDVGCLPFTILKIIDLEKGTITVLTDGNKWIGDPSWQPTK